MNVARHRRTLKAGLSGGDHTCFGDWKRLLLLRFGILLEQAVVLRLICFGGALELTKRHLDLVGLLRLRHSPSKLFLGGFLIEFSNLEITFVGFSQSHQLLSDRCQYSTHLIAKIDGRQMSWTETPRP